MAMLYDDAFKALFSESEEQALRTRTRIGRAMHFYNQSFDLPPLYAFLARCLVLETLFTIGSGEVTHKLSVRLAKICVKNRDGDEVHDYYQRAKTLYNERSKVIHGQGSLAAVDDGVREDAAILAGLSLRSILLQDDILEYFSDSATSDKKKGRRELQLREFFLDLELR